MSTWSEQDNRKLLTDFSLWWQSTISTKDPGWYSAEYWQTMISRFLAERQEKNGASQA